MQGASWILGNDISQAHSVSDESRAAYQDRARLAHENLSLLRLCELTICDDSKTGLATLCRRKGRSARTTTTDN